MTDKDLASSYGLRAYLAGSPHALGNVGEDNWTTKDWYELGDKYFAGTDRKEKDRTLARACYEKAINLNSKKDTTEYLNSLYSLGVIHHYGFGTPVNLAKAEEYHNQAVTKGDFYFSQKELLILRNKKLPNHQQLTTAQHWYNAGQQHYRSKTFSLARACYEIAINIEKPEHAEALYSLGWMYEHAEGGLRKDLTQARTLYWKAAQADCYNAIYNLLLLDNSSFHSSQEWYGLGEKYNYGRDNRIQNNTYARACYMHARNSKAIMLPSYSDANYSLGHIYHHGKGVAIDKVQAKNFYEEAAGLGSYESKKALLQLNNPDTDTPAKWTDLGEEYYFAKNGKKKDLVLARACYELAIENPSAQPAYALYSLGFIFSRGQDVAKDVTKGKQFFEKAAKQDHLESKLELLKLEDPQLESNRSEDWRFAGRTSYGLDFDDDYPRALICYQQALKLAPDNHEILIELGQMYERENNSNLVLAVKYYQQALEKGNTSAQLLLDQVMQSDLPGETANSIGVLYHNADGVVRNYQTAASWYLKAIDKHNANAFFNIGLLFENGYGQVKCLFTAAIYYLNALEAGKKETQHTLDKLLQREDFTPGLIFSLGLVVYDAGASRENGLTQNYTFAKQCFEVAGAKGDAEALRTLGFMYEFGNGMPISLKLAVQFYQKAVDKGRPNAQDDLDRLFNDSDICSWDHADLRMVYRSARKLSSEYYQAERWAKLFYQEMNKSNLAQAERLLETILTQTDMSSEDINAMGTTFCDATGEVCNYLLAKKCFELASDKGLHEATRNLGWIYESGSGLPEPNYLLAEKYYQQALLGLHLPAKIDLVRVAGILSQIKSTHTNLDGSKPVKNTEQKDKPDEVITDKKAEELPQNPSASIQTESKPLVKSNILTEDKQIKKITFFAKQKATVDSWYNDADINTVHVCKVRAIGGYKENCQYRLARTFVEDNKSYIVLTTPAILSSQIAGSVPINYFIDKSNQPSDIYSNLLRTILPSLPSIRSNRDELRRNQILQLIGHHLSANDGGDTVNMIYNLLNRLNFDVHQLERELLNRRYVSNKDTFDEIQTDLLSSPNVNVKIVFPYNIDRRHWITCEIKIAKQGNAYCIVVTPHDPYGEGNIDQDNFNALKNSLQNRIRELNSDAIFSSCTLVRSCYRRRQNDSTSCGVITLEDLFHRIQGNPLTQSYPNGASSMRETHRNLVEQTLPADNLDRQMFLERHPCDHQAAGSNLRLHA